MDATHERHGAVPAGHGLLRTDARLLHTCAQQRPPAGGKHTERLRRQHRRTAEADTQRTEGTGGASGCHTATAGQEEVRRTDTGRPRHEVRMRKGCRGTEAEEECRAAHLRQAERRG